MSKRIGAVVTALLLAIGLSVTPQASAATSYTWIHEWYRDGTGVTVQYSASNFTRVSYVHGTTCTEEKLEFWPSGTVAIYRRYSSTSSCSGVSWGTAFWRSPNAGTSSTLSWQSDLNWVLRDQQGVAVFASGTNSAVHSGERMKLGNSANGYLYLDYQYAGVWWAQKRYPPY
jgi:hypothetical protein